MLPNFFFFYTCDLNDTKLPKILRANYNIKEIFKIFTLVLREMILEINLVKLWFLK